jgi:hypothetical protein
MNIRLYTLIAALFLALVAPRPGISAATILPPAETCFQATTGISGQIGALGTPTGGSGGTSGTYFAVPLTGGFGMNATATIVVSGGAVTSVTVLNPGTQYQVGDVLSALSGNIGGVTGFVVPVIATTINSSLAGGHVWFYVPNTTVPKQTWQNAAQTILNTNPVTLNQNGCAVIYGTGVYRQVLQDSLGNTVWDQITTDVSANNNYFWAGLAGGTPNALTVTDAGFNGTDGSILAFIPLSTNTGAATLNPSNYFGGSPPSIVKDTSTGAVPLTGGEMVANSPSNIVEVVYSASQGNFHILNLVAATGAQISPPLCSARGLTISNSSATPGVFSITFQQVIMINTTNGSYISRGNPAAPYTVTVNFSTNGVGGLDTGSLQPNTPYYIYVTDNGTAPAGLGSASSTAPFKPSGYPYNCRVGAIVTDATAPNGIPYQFNQKGAFVNYVVTPGTNTSAPPNIVNGTAGSLSPLTAPTLASQSLTDFVPATATQAMLSVTNGWEGKTLATVLVAPNLNWGGTENGPNGTNGIIWPVYLTNGTQQGAFVTFNLEAAQTFGYASGGNGGAVNIYGWKDSVNAD